MFANIYKFYYYSKALSSRGIDCDFLYGQSYDGASNMSGKYNGVQTVIRQKYSKALYVHCATHSLNLAVSTSCNIKSIRNCLGIVKKLYVFFNTPKRQNVLISEIEISDTEFRVKTLKRLCCTRWVQKYDSMNDFYELFPVVVKALDTICSEWSDSTDASILKKCILDSEFLIALSVTKVPTIFLIPTFRAVLTICFKVSISAYQWNFYGLNSTSLCYLTLY